MDRMTVWLLYWTIKRNWAFQRVKCLEHGVGYVGRPFSPFSSPSFVAWLIRLHPLLGVKWKQVISANYCWSFHGIHTLTHLMCPDDQVKYKYFSGQSAFVVKLQMARIGNWISSSSRTNVFRGSIRIFLISENFANRLWLPSNASCNQLSSSAAIQDSDF